MESAANLSAAIDDDLSGACHGRRLSLDCRAMRPRWLANWLERHQHPVSFWLHVLGIPMTIVAIPLALVQLSRDQWDLWWRPAALFLGGYFLQWVGHLVEGNDMGEWILVKKLMGRPYTAVSPRYRDRSPAK